MSENGTNVLERTALDACAREPIHIPGAIQPHGALLALREPDLTCLQISANWPELCGSPEPADALPGTPLEVLLGPEAAETIRALSRSDNDPALAAPLPLTINGRRFDAAPHRHDGVLILEMEPVEEGTPRSFTRVLQRAFAALRAAEGLEEVYQLAARFIAELTGYGRVMVYKFDTDWHGEVVGECRPDPATDSYLGHHFPASDIPEQARALYTKSWLRSIPNVDYRPAPLIPSLNPATGRPLDLGFSMLRSVSPVHLEYLRNMKVGASMSVSLITGGRLWGLIACHHATAKRLPYATREACELFGQVASLEIAAREETLRLGEHARATRIQTRFFDVIAREQNFVEALVKYTPDLLNFMDAAGAAIHVNGRTTLLGETPEPENASLLLDWLRTVEMTPLFCTDSLGGHLPTASDWREKASGLLAVRLSPVEFQCVLFFRPEVVTAVTWAGNPHKPVEPGLALHPRKSFSAWKEIVRGKSKPWTEAERQGAIELRDALNALVLRRTERLISLNAELERKNTDLNSFAYIASHDLKEPLRGISLYGLFIEEDHGEELPPPAREKLRAIRALAAQSEHLLETLGRFSRIGRMELRRRMISLEELVDEALTSLNMLLGETNTRIHRPRPLPEAYCDPVLTREVFANLIANAVKYNDSPEKLVEIGWRDSDVPGGPPVFYVKDNGIGVPEKHFHNIFLMFRRLHAQEERGGGSGAGLAIAKSIVERHGGRIEVKSKVNEGSTFYFTLS